MAERIGSNEWETHLTLQMPCAPLPVSVLFGLELSGGIHECGVARVVAPDEGKEENSLNR